MFGIDFWPDFNRARRAEDVSSPPCLKITERYATPLDGGRAKAEGRGSRVAGFGFVTPDEGEGELFVHQVRPWGTQLIVEQWGLPGPDSSTRLIGRCPGGFQGV